MTILMRWNPAHKKKNHYFSKNTINGCSFPPFPDGGWPRNVLSGLPVSPSSSSPEEEEEWEGGVSFDCCVCGSRPSAFWKEPSIPPLLTLSLRSPFACDDEAWEYHPISLRLMPRYQSVGTRSHNRWRNPTAIERRGALRLSLVKWSSLRWLSFFFPSSSPQYK